MKRLLVVVAILLFGALPVMAQSPQIFKGCGTLSEASQGCLLFNADDGSGSFLLDRYGSFVSGDSVYVIGLVDTLCSNDCGAVCLHNLGISDCGHCCIGTRGDLNQDGMVDVSDLMCVVSYLFHFGDPCFDQLCTEMLDFDGDGNLDISDLMYVIAFLFRGGPPPPACP